MSMNYGYPYYQNNMLAPHPNTFANAVQQTYGNQTQMPMLQQPQQQNVMQQAQSLNNSGSKILAVASKEEATGAQVDLISGAPSFFYNKSNGEIYLKQFDVPTGTAIFKVYGEIIQEKDNAKQENIQIANYEKELHYISEGIDNLHRMIADLKMQKTDDIIPEKEYEDKKAIKGKKA